MKSKDDSGVPSLLSKEPLILSTDPSLPLDLGPGLYTIQQKSNGRYVDAHEYAEKDYALVTRSPQNNDTQKWILTPIVDDV